MAGSIAIGGIGGGANACGAGGNEVATPDGSAGLRSGGDEVTTACRIAGAFDDGGGGGGVGWLPRTTLCIRDISSALRPDSAG